MVNLTFRPMDRTPGDLELFRATFERNGSPRSMKHLEWQYVENPTGKLYVELAIPDNDAARAAAIYAVMPVMLRLNGEVVLGTQSLDTLTDVDFRGKGLFVKMATSVFGRCQKDGVACVYGFPNGSSAPGFFRKLEWARLDPVPFLFKPLSVNYFLRRLGPIAPFAARLPRVPIALARRPQLPRSEEIRPVSAFDAAFDALWQQFAEGVGTAVQRDSRYLTWRLKKKPDQKYRLLALTENGELRAFVAFDVQDKHGGKVGYVLELLHAPGRRDQASRLLDEAIAEMASQGAEVALAWCLDHSPNYRAYRNSGFLPLPERLRPIELHAGVRALAAPTEANLGNRRNWYLSYCDSDTV